MDTTTRISGLEDLLKNHSGKGPPPVERWNPPYCGDMDMEIRADGTYGEEGYVYQRYTPIPSFEGNFVTIGSWIVGDAPAGIGLREDATEITMNTSRFIPHYFD